MDKFRIFGSTSLFAYKKEIIEKLKEFSNYQTNLTGIQDIAEKVVIASSKYDLMDDIYATPEIQSIDMEISEYIGLQVIRNFGDDPLKFWKLNLNKFPLLSKTARSIFEIQQLQHLLNATVALLV